MYEAYFGLDRRPFGSVPQVDHYFPAATVEAARQSLVRCIDRAEGVGMIVGPSGIGKTLLCLMLVEQFRESFGVAVLCSGRLSTRRALFQAILYELGLPYSGMDEGELRLALVDYLTLAKDAPAGLVLLVDEAHTLPLRLLEEIRMMTNIVSSGQPRVRLVLAGGPLLEERFASPKLDSFSQRIVARCYLESFDRCETEGYIQAQIDIAGGKGRQIIPPEASQAVYQATDGVPRLINQVCDHALLLAHAGGREQLDSAGIEEAWADLQQLPMPWNAPSGSEASGGVIEFGGLEDEPAVEGPAEGDEPSQPPLLRVRPAEDEQAAEPAEHIERIEEALAGVDGDFRPAGSIGPELELVVDDPENPFSEKFEKDELVVDGLASPDVEDADDPSETIVTQPAALPDEGPLEETDGPDEQTASVAGELLPQQPAEVRDAYRGQSTAILDSCSDAPAEIEEAALEEPAGEGASKAPCAQLSSQVSSQVCSQVPSQVAPAKHTPAEHAPGACEHAACRTVPMSGREPLGLVGPEDRDMIVVEDGYEGSQSPPVRSVAPVHRQDYRQLFVTLRRG